LDPNAGAILSLVGGRDVQGSQFNRAIQARRQPGSAFKPIVYAAALDKGYTPVTTILDSPLVLFMKAEGAAKEFWEPNNYDEQFRGRITFRKALTQSRNVATVKILRDIGIDYVINYAQRLGIASPLNRDLSLALGSSGMSLLELVSAYSVFAAGGVRAEPVFIAKILDRNDEILEENRPRLIQAISPQTAYLMTSLLQSVVEEGTGRRVRALGRPCAGKTGTTNEVRDAWFIGFTPDLIAGVWVGFDDETPLGKHETGAVAASPIWLTFMQEALRRSSMKVFTSPEGIIFMKVDPENPLRKELYPRESGSQVEPVVPFLRDSSPPHGPPLVVYPANLLFRDASLDESPIASSQCLPFLRAKISIAQPYVNPHILGVNEGFLTCLYILHSCLLPKPKPKFVLPITLQDLPEVSSFVVILYFQRQEIMLINPADPFAIAHVFSNRNTFD
jgi:membrane carboxypeptidase/penicillin-binding protein